MPRDLDRAVWSEIVDFPERRPLDLEACRQAGERKRQLLSVVDELQRMLVRGQEDPQWARQRRTRAVEKVLAAEKRAALGPELRREISGLADELLPILGERMRLDEVEDALNVRACRTAEKVAAELRRQMSAGDDDPSIEVLDLSPRVTTILMRQGFHTVGTLLSQAVKPAGFGGIGYIGPKSSAEITAALRACGFTERLG